jgi:streptomycin 6-kinase
LNLAVEFDLSQSKAAADEAATHWGLDVEPPFSLSNVSYVAPAGDVVVKVAWLGDDESLHEPDALSLWNGNGSVRLLGRVGRAILEERAVPGHDLSALPESAATAVAIDVASRLWRTAQAPFRPVLPEVRRWLERAADEGSELVPYAQQLLRRIGEPADWVVHGDFHHHNILLHGERYVAIDPKPYLAEREYDVPSFLWNPMDNRLDNPALLEERIAAFGAAGLDDFRIRAWTVIRGAYLRPAYAARIGALL